MAGIAALAGGPWRVAPGETSEIAVTVRNTGTVVDQFALDVLGDVAAWATIEPSVLSLFPGGEGQAIVRLQPPRGTVAAGEHPFAVRVVGAEEEWSVVEEGVIDVTGYAAIGAELTPRASEGRSGRHAIHIMNLGNTQLDAAVEVDDPDEQLVFRLEQTSVTVAAGETATVALKVLPRHRDGTRRPFQVRVSATGSSQVALEGAFAPASHGPRAWPKVVIAAAVLLAAVLIASQLARSKDQVTLATSTTPTTAAAAEQGTDEAVEPAIEEENSAAGVAAAAAAEVAAAAAGTPGGERAAKSAVVAEASGAALPPTTAAPAPPPTAATATTVASASPAPSTTAAPLPALVVLERFYHEARRDFYFATDPADRDRAYADGYGGNGNPGKVFVSEAPGTVGLVRFWHPTEGHHYLSASAEGAADAERRGFVRQKIIGWIYPASSSSGVPFYRMFHSSPYSYYYCISATEKRAAEDAGWVEVGIEGRLPA